LGDRATTIHREGKKHLLIQTNDAGEKDENAEKKKYQQLN
jgi:hypothetical protein